MFTFIEALHRYHFDVDLMGLRMDDLHAPTVSSGPTSQPSADGIEKTLSLQELIAKKDNVEAELSALGSVLDSVCTPGLLVMR